MKPTFKNCGILFCCKKVVILGLTLLIYLQSQAESLKDDRLKLRSAKLAAEGVNMHEHLTSFNTTFFDA
jgi:hypothetical protein